MTRINGMCVTKTRNTDAAQSSTASRMIPAFLALSCENRTRQMLVQTTHFQRAVTLLSLMRTPHPSLILEKCLHCKYTFPGSAQPLRRELQGRAASGFSANAPVLCHAALCPYSLRHCVSAVTCRKFERNPPNPASSNGLIFIIPCLSKKIKRIFNFFLEISPELC